MLLIVIGETVLDGDSLTSAKKEAANAVTYERWSRESKFFPYRIHGKSFRNVPAWQAFESNERVRRYLCAAAGVPFK